MQGWKGAKAMMSDGSFLKSLKNYDKDKVNDKVRAHVLHTVCTFCTTSHRCLV